MFQNIYKILVIGLFLAFCPLILSAQSVQNCDTISTSNKAKNDCIFEVYSKSEKNLGNVFKSTIKKLTIKKSKSLIQFLKDAQTQWLLNKDYNAKVHASYELTTKQAEYAFYKSKALDNLNRAQFLKTFTDSLNIK